MRSRTTTRLELNGDNQLRRTENMLTLHRPEHANRLGRRFISHDFQQSSDVMTYFMTLSLRGYMHTHTAPVTFTSKCVDLLPVDILVSFLVIGQQVFRSKIRSKNTVIMLSFITR